MIIECQKCRKRVNVQNFDRNFTCSSCGGYFSEVNNRNYNISSQFEQIGKQFQGTIPHIMIGERGIMTNRNTQVRQNNPNLNTQNTNLGYPNQVYQNPNQNMTFTDKIMSNSEKIKTWALWIMVSLVVGFAVYSILF